MATKKYKKDIVKLLLASDKSAYNASFDVAPKRKMVNKNADITNNTYKKRVKKQGPNKRK
jgi:hypothetical protein